MSDKQSQQTGAKPAYVLQLEQRIADLESKLEALAEQHYWLGQRLLHLSLATLPEPRFPFWTYYIRSHMPEETRQGLGMLVALLTFRANGEPIPDPLRKDIEGVPHELLNSSEPLTAENISTAVKAVTGILHESEVVELFEAMKGQGIHVELCDFYLANHPPLLSSQVDEEGDSK